LNGIPGFVELARQFIEVLCGQERLGLGRLLFVQKRVSTRHDARQHHTHGKGEE
jgi:hypothetical protein